jgi:hypothetical protein
MARGVAIVVDELEVTGLPPLIARDERHYSEAARVG